jgi:hypothetical protein
MSRTPERRRRGRSETVRRRHRREDERRWALLKEPTAAESRSRDRKAPERPMDIIERHRDNHPTKTRTIVGKRS